MTERQEKYLTSRRPIQIPSELLAQLEARRAALERMIQAAVNALPALVEHAPELAGALMAAIQGYAPGALKGDGQGDSRIAPTNDMPTSVPDGD